MKKLDYIDKNEELNLCINNLVSRCFISLYSEIVEIEILRNIWDIFFVQMAFEKILMSHCGVSSSTHTIPPTWPTPTYAISPDGPTPTYTITQ